MRTPLRVNGGGLDDVAGAGDGAAENVDSGSEVADAARRERANDVLGRPGSAGQ